MKYSVEHLGPHHGREGFVSGSEPLDRYLKQQAGQDVRRHVASLFVLCEPPDSSVLGYYSLSALSLRVDDFPAEFARKLPRYPVLRATLLGRLAVDQSCRGKRLGRALLFDALERSFVASTSVASVAVVVDAKDEAAKAFYEHHEFIPFPAAPNRLFLPMKTIQHLCNR